MTKGRECCLWIPTFSHLLNVIRSTSQSLQEVSVVYESQHSHILLNVIRSPSWCLQWVSVVYESQHSNILLNVIRSPSRCPQDVSIIYESQHSHILMNVISPSRSLQWVSVIYESQHSHIKLNVSRSPSRSLQIVTSGKWHFFLGGLSYLFALKEFLRRISKIRRLTCLEIFEL